MGNWESSENPSNVDLKLEYAGYPDKMQIVIWGLELSSKGGAPGWGLHLEWSFSRRHVVNDKEVNFRKSSQVSSVLEVNWQDSSVLMRMSSHYLVIPLGFWFPVFLRGPDDPGVTQPQVWATIFKALSEANDKMCFTHIMSSNPHTPFLWIKIQSW